MMKNILFVCTSASDRSPALAEYFSKVFPEHNYKYAGVNKYFTEKKGTPYLTKEYIYWADLIVFAEDIHYLITKRDFSDCGGLNHFRILNCGEYKQGSVGEDYLTKAEEKIKDNLS